MSAGFYKRLFLVLCLLILLPAASHVQAALININTAGVAELDTLPGIGPAYAQRIIDYRNLNGLYQKIEDIKNVSGIGNVTFANLKDYITVGAISGSEENVFDQEENTTTATTTAETTTSSSQSSSNTVTVSTHYIATPLTAVKPDTKFAVGAGRDRLGTVGTPIEFRVESNNETTRQTTFKWNFGDGMVGNGEVTNHSYLYPGEYVVVLNASGPDGQAVSRTNVRIVPSELSVSFASPERIEITNNSKSEVNLYGRAIVAGSKIFVLPQDTIIKSGQKISFTSNVTGLNPINQSYVSLVIVGTEARPQEVIAKMEGQRLEKITSIRNEIAVLEQRRLALLQRQTPNPEAVAENENRPLITEIEDIEDRATGQTALVLDSVSEAEFGRMGNWLQTLKSFFFRTQ